MAAVRPTTKEEDRHLDRLLRLWLWVVGAGLLCFLANPIATRALHGSSRAVVATPLTACVLIATAGVAPLRRLLRAARSRRVFLFRGTVSQSLSSWIAAAPFTFGKDGQTELEVTAGGDIVLVAGKTVPELGFLNVVPVSAKVSRPAVGDTEFVGERSLNPGERRELSVALLTMLCHMALRAMTVPMFVFMLLFCLDASHQLLLPNGVWALKAGVGLWALHWLYGFARLLLIAADLLRGRCRRRPGWDLVTLPWSKTAWSKNDRPAEWRLDDIGYRGVPPRARTVRQAEA